MQQHHNSSMDIEAVMDAIRQHGRKKMRLDQERAEVIIYGVQLEESLGYLLSDFMIKGKDSSELIDKILCNFNSRIQLAYSLGLISNIERNDLHVIRRIRNDFAHKEECSFSDPNIIKMCNSFKLPTLDPTHFSDYDAFETFSWVAFLHTQIIVERSRLAEKRKCAIAEELHSNNWSDFFA